MVSTVATYRQTFKQNTVYRLRVEVVGNEIAVFLDGEEVIRTTDNSHTVGALGLNVFNGSAFFNNIAYEVIETGTSE